MTVPHPAQRLILHADMDCFFAAVEERENPAYKGKPVVIGSDPRGGEGRGIVATANYQARRFGIGSAMPISTAYRRCPDAVYLRPDFGLYTAASKSVMRILEAKADILEQVSIDEAYLDCSRLGTFEDGRHLAQELQRSILEEVSLSVSIGVGPNKLIAKIASDHKKPAGITVVIPSRVAEFLGPLSVRVLRGVGPKTEEHLAGMGYRKVSDLREASEGSLTRAFGKFGHFLFREARGEDHRLVDPRWEAKSMGRERTFQTDSSDYDEVRALMLDCVDKVHSEMTGDGFWCHTLTVKLRYQGYETHSKQVTLKQSTGDPERLRAAALELMEPFLKDKRPIRLVGFTVSRLAPPDDLLPLGRV